MPDSWSQKKNEEKTKHFRINEKLNLLKMVMAGLENMENVQFYEQINLHLNEFTHSSLRFCKNSFRSNGRYIEFCIGDYWRIMKIKLDELMHA